MCLAAEIWNPCMPRASAALCSASTIMCTWVRWMLTCTIRNHSRIAAVIVASRIALYSLRRRMLPTAGTIRITTCSA